MQSILVVDDEPDFITGFRRVLAREDLQVHSALSGTEAVEHVRRNKPDVIFMDLRMPGMDGLATLKRLRDLDSRLIVIIMTAHTTTATVIEAMKCGAYDFIAKPFSGPRLREMASEALRVAQDMRQMVSYQTGVPVSEDELSGETIIGGSEPMQDVYKAIGQVAASNATVLITGESGTGKELVARAIYKHSDRAEKVFVPVNCAAIPESLLESELFGHEKGSFTGAMSRKLGKFETARNGTIFLDEIGDMSLSTQTKILRVLQDGGFQRVGGSETIEVDVRVIAATNRDLKSMIRQGLFRSDLYYRLNVVSIELPPLRDRREDIPQLVEYFLRRLARETRRQSPAISQNAMDRMVSYAWPGNVRELENVIRNLVLTAKTDTILPSDLKLSGEALVEPGAAVSLPTQVAAGQAGMLGPSSVAPARPAAAEPAPASGIAEEDDEDEGGVVLDGGAFRDVESAIRPLFDQLVDARDRGDRFSTFDVVERALILHALNRVAGNQVQAARLLGITRSTLRKRILRYGLKIDTTVR
jgi:two-component system nitrogen regulation response regulator GlnG